MAERKALSKKMRFEVFKRDKFTCQYCGRSAPDVILHVDHIKPVKEGGTNDIMNLVTACKECNAGKGARELSDDSVIRKQKAQIADLAEKNEQLDMFLEWRNGLRDITEREIDAINATFNDTAKTDIEFNDNARRKVKSLLKKHSLGVLLTATEEVVTRYIECHRKLNIKVFDDIDIQAKRAENPTSEHEKKVYYLRKILINRFRLDWAEKEQAYNVIDDLLCSGVEFSKIKRICSQCGDFYNFLDDAWEAKKNESGE